MNAGKTNLLTKAATTTRIIYPTQTSRPQRFRNDASNTQTRSICTAPASSLRPKLLISAQRTSGTTQKRTFHATSRHLATKNPYTVLGVDKGSSAGDIKKAYYGLAKKFHPDTNKDPTAKDKFAEAQSAYELLTDPQKKAAWDQYGAAAFDQGAGPSPGGGSPFGGGNPFTGGGGGSPFGGGFGADFDFEDLFKGFTGGGGGRRSGRQGGFQQEILVGDNIDVQTTVSFMEAAKGTTKSISITPLVTCKTCSGNGLKAGTKKSECKSCGGTGTRVVNMGGGFQMATTCTSCGGNGVTVPKGSECKSCAGNGVVHAKKSINVDIPGGIEDGMRLRLDREGDAPATGKSANPGANAIPGDLYVLVRVATDPKFSRSGSDVLYTATLPVTTAMLGGEVSIPTLDGEVKVKIATGTATGDKITLSGMGMKKLQGRRTGSGDLRVEFKVAMPKYLNTNQRTILEMLADELNDQTAKRVMNVGRKDDDHTKHEGFLKSVWHKLTDDGSHAKEAVEDAMKNASKEKSSASDPRSADDKTKKSSDSDS
ncbi:DnaJ-like protein 1, mitochondrial [Lachnellula willkommii]|uniref:DnaJ homolog 1, mitochondrial n=1 Tax=Lachnellula willkommii TaxID=215461 RepID=A0A559M3I7_9HELO|nr:DnaJ-like protein 1, mitochondrial [Lachnellula willkommii]